jgi:hypothetical protein
MSYETRSYSPESAGSQAPQLELETQRLERLIEPTPTQILGDLVISSLLGGALGGSNGVMPRTEAITLEALSGTVELSGRVLRSRPAKQSLARPTIKC